MATNYTVGQAFDVINEGKDVEAIADIARRFPLVAVYSAKLAPVAGAASELLNSLPDYMTARKVEKGLRGAIGADIDDEADAETEDETEAEAEPADEAPKKRGRKAKAKPEPEPDATEEAESDSKYAGKNAMELFKECKKRGIKCQPKKPAKFYVDLLEKADAEGAQESEDEDDDWDI